MEMLVKPGSTHSFCTADNTEKMRADLYLARTFPAYSRTFFQQLIEDGRISVNGVLLERPSMAIKPNDQVSIAFPSLRLVDHRTVSDTLEERKLEVEIVAEHEHFLIVNKPAYLLVHPPSARSTAITLVDWLTTHYPDIISVGYTDRPGIVHRLDKDTSGLLIVPRTPHAHNVFSKLFKSRAIGKTYLAVVQGHPPASGTIDLPIGRDPHSPQKMTVFHTQQTTNRIYLKARSAITHFRVRTYFKDAALLELHLVTGRTHQIRVHCSAIGHPLLGDPVYGIKSKLIKRQALHAHRLTFNFDNTDYTFHRQPPADFMALTDALERA